MKWSDVRQRRPSKYIQIFYVNLHLDSIINMVIYAINIKQPNDTLYKNNITK